ncbi:MAG TPA: hypothetical protein VLR88_08040 [Propionibacteriaceae bacterium]|nr:hypothetical protein [Propionibacteriaceae bacterium]
MNTDVPQSDTRPLTGPDGRFPSVAAVTVRKESGVRALREGWLPRHSLTMAVLTPALAYVYLTSLVMSLTPAWALIIGMLAVMGALVVTTYLPLRGGTAGVGSSCSLMAGLVVPMVAVLLSGATSLASGAMALALLTVAMAQRLSGASACRS